MRLDGLHITIKPTGSKCNLDCDYCFYLEKEKLYPSDQPFKMSDEILEKYIQQHIAAQPNNAVFYSFSWQGGEPTMMGIDFFRKAVALQKKYAKGVRCENTFQTNGILLNELWCYFFAEEGFLVGISLDGNAHHHNEYRKTRSKKETHQQVLNAIKLLQKHRVEFNVLTVLHKGNVDEALTVYRYLKSLGVQYIQFTPLVERLNRSKSVDGLHLAHPDFLGPTNIAPWSITAKQYANALISIFDEWSVNDLGNIFINTFETTLGLAIGEPSNSCIFAPTCGKAVVLEHNGDIYSCDHFVYRKHLVGNILTQPLADIVARPEQQLFGQIKQDNLSIECSCCNYYALCHGGCPKHRFSLAQNGQQNKNYFCEGYKRYFQHTLPYFKIIFDGLCSGKTVQATRQQIRLAQQQ